MNDTTDIQLLRVDVEGDHVTVTKGDDVVRASK